MKFKTLIMRRINIYYKNHMVNAGILDLEEIYC